MKARGCANKKIPNRSAPESRDCVDLWLPCCRCGNAWFNHVCFMFPPPCPPLPSPPEELLPSSSPPNQLLPSRCLFFYLRARRMHLFNSFFSFQMVQAIQVLRFHLLELEKVSILQICIAKFIMILPITRVPTRVRCTILWFRFFFCSRIP